MFTLYIDPKNYSTFVNVSQSLRLGWKKSVTYTESTIYVNGYKSQTFETRGLASNPAKTASESWSKYRKSILKTASKLLDQLNKEGGFTCDRSGKSKEVNGYAVSLLNPGIILDNQSNPLPSIVKLLENLPDNTYLGGWIDNGVIYLDYTLIIPDYDTAFSIAVINKQKAIYNGLTEEVVYIPQAENRERIDAALALGELTFDKLPAAIRKLEAAIL